MTTYLEYAARGANAWWRYALAAVVTALLTIALGMALMFGLEAAGHVPSEAAGDLLEPGDAAAYFIATGWLFGLILVGFLVAVWLMQRKSPLAIFGRWSWRLWLVGFGIWIVVAAVGVLLDFAIAPSGFSVAASRQTVWLVAAALPALAVQTFAEEVIFRGWMTQGLLLWLRRPLIVALVSGAAFGALHIENGWPQAASATVFGVATAMIAIRTGGIAFTSGLHLANNLFGAVVVVANHDVFRGAPGLFAQETPHLMWWDALFGSIAIIALATVIVRREGRPPQV